MLSSMLGAALDNVSIDTYPNLTLKISGRTQDSQHVSPSILFLKKLDVSTQLLILVFQGMLRHANDRERFELIQ